MPRDEIAQISSAVLDGCDIAYAPGLIIECRAVNNDVERTPFNFLDYYDEAKANVMALKLSREVVEVVFEDRNKIPDNVLDLPEAPSVFKFVTETLGMEPVGKLLYVADSQEVKSAGVTYNGKRQSIVVRDKTVQTFDHYDRVFADSRQEAFNNFRVAAVAVHELTHLAGMPDILYFIVDPAPEPAITHIIAPGSCLEGWPNTHEGKYFEEGLATLVTNIYAWQRIPETTATTLTKPYQSPSGTRIDLPSRSTNAIHNDYSMLGWGIERLIALEPDIWDIFMTSRKYNTASNISRLALRECLDYAAPHLFEAIDTTDIEDLDNVMETTLRIDHTAKSFGA